MICLVLTLAAGIGSCRMDRPGAVGPSDAVLLDGSVQPNKLDLKYVCGNRYRVRNHNDAVATVSWRVIGTSDSGVVSVPAKGNGPPNGYGEAMFTTNLPGETGMYFQGQLVETEPNKSNACPSGNFVPGTAPDTLPRGYLADSNLVMDSPGSPAKFVKDHVLIFFKPTATQTERQQAIDAVSGIVVGGFHWPAGGEGGYVVRLPHDATNELPREAVTLLIQLPSVRLATLDYVNAVGAPTYRRADDLGGWGLHAWRITPRATFPLSASRQTWALEAINAPLAWGCSVGDSITRVAVIDQGFHTADWAGDAENVIAVDLDNLNNDNLDHGSRVASVLGARGNNRSGMTGAMWRVALDLRDVTLRDSLTRAPVLDSAGRRQTGRAVDLFTKMQRAVVAGARIINISLGATTPILQRDSIGRSRVQSIIEQTQIATLNLLGLTTDPLFVVSAGNIPNGDPFGSLWPTLKDSLESRVLVVTAVNADGSLAFAPPNNSLIDLAAPGEQVGSLSAGSVVGSSGSSFATPLVSGIAGLLFAFDSSLTAAQVREFILEGARRSGRVVGGYPVPDAYEALKVAAERPGAPLCGNRVWARNGALFAQRGALDLAGEQLFSEVAGTQIAAIDVQHGGREIRYSAFTGYNVDGGTATPRSIVYDAISRAWHRGPDPFFGLDTSSAGATRSYRVQSHDGDSVVTIFAGADGTGADVVGVQLSVGGAIVRSTIQTVGAVGLPFTYCSAILLGSCDQTSVGDPLDGFRRVAAAYPPVGDTVLFAVNLLQADTQYVNTAGTCHGAPCTGVELRYFLSPQRADLYRVTLSGNPLQPMLVRSISDSIVYQVGFSEDAREKVLTVGRSIDSTAAPTAGIVGSSTVQTCRFEWSAPTWTSLGALLQISNASACPGSNVAGDLGGGTFAPRRKGPILTPIAERSSKKRSAPMSPRH